MIQDIDILKAALPTLQREAEEAQERLSRLQEMIAGAGGLPVTWDDRKFTPAVSPETTPAPPPTKPKAPRKCRKCGVEGHDARNCTKAAAPAEPQAPAPAAQPPAMPGWHMAEELPDPLDEKYANEPKIWVDGVLYERNEENTAWRKCA